MSSIAWRGRGAFSCFAADSGYSGAFIISLYVFFAKVIYFHTLPCMRLYVCAYVMCVCTYVSLCHSFEYQTRWSHVPTADKEVDVNQMPGSSWHSTRQARVRRLCSCCFLCVFVLRCVSVILPFFSLISEPVLSNVWDVCVCVHLFVLFIPIPFHYRSHSCVSLRVCVCVDTVVVRSCLIFEQLFRPVVMTVPDNELISRLCCTWLHFALLIFVFVSLCCNM